nr:MAG TPA: hypothetical protein [Caudoviricetes sp.]
MGNNSPNPAALIMQAIASGRPLDSVLDAIGKQSPEMDRAVYGIYRGGVIIEQGLCGPCSFFVLQKNRKKS